MRRVPWVQSLKATTAKEPRNLDSEHAKCGGVQQNKEHDSVLDFLEQMRMHAHTRDNVRGGFWHRREIGGKRCAQMLHPIRMKLRTVTHWPRPGGVVVLRFAKSSARGHLSCEIISRLALWRKFDKFNFPVASRCDLEKCPLQT